MGSRRRLAFVASIMIAIVGALNIVWGIAAIGKSKFFTQNAILSDLNTWGGSC